MIAFLVCVGIVFYILCMIIAYGLTKNYYRTLCGRENYEQSVMQKMMEGYVYDRAKELSSRICTYTLGKELTCLYFGLLGPAGVMIALALSDMSFTLCYHMPKELCEPRQRL